MTQTDNVIPIKQDEEEPDETYAFNALYSAYLKAQGRHEPGLTDEALDRAGAAVEELVWKIIRCRAETPYQVGYQLAVLRDMYGDDGKFIDHRDMMLIESIRSDVSRGV